jgi:hypothetical protein
MPLVQSQRKNKVCVCLHVCVWGGRGVSVREGSSSPPSPRAAASCAQDPTLVYIASMGLVYRVRADAVVGVITRPVVLWSCLLAFLCATHGRYLGSSDDATIGDDFVGEKTNCPAPRPIPTPEVHAPRAYANQYPNRASLNEDPAFFHPLQCQWQYQQRLTVRTERGPQQSPRLLPLLVWELLCGSFCLVSHVFAWCSSCWLDAREPSFLLDACCECAAQRQAQWHPVRTLGGHRRRHRDRRRGLCAAGD